jgi:formylglycine-generating enzyme required for sulfatase activity
MPNSCPKSGDRQKKSGKRRNHLTKRFIAQLCILFCFPAIPFDYLPKPRHLLYTYPIRRWGMKRSVIFLLILLAGTALWAQHRHALVIGNANYPQANARLPNTINDTTDMRAALTALGYSVVLKQNLNRLDMIGEVNAFIARLQSNRNSEGFFWYAGHALEINGENYLMPLDVVTDRGDEFVKETSYSVTNLTRQLDNARNKVNVVVLDACRVPPGGGGGRGYGASRVIKTVPNLPPDLLVIYSTASGTEASDGTGRRNSPFTEAFLKHIRSTEPLTLMMGHVTNETMSLTQQIQRPYHSGSITNDVYYSLNPAGVRPPEPTPPPQQATGRITITSHIAGEIMINGRATGSQISEGGTLTFNNVVTGTTEVAVRQSNGTVSRAPNTVVRQGQTATATIERPAAPPQPAPATVTPAATPQRPVPDNMVRINGGTFMMGSPASEPQRSDNETQHQVTVSSFYMGKYPVTQREYQQVMGTNPSNFKGDNLPVEKVRWYDALVFCNKLSMKEGLSPAYSINGSTDPAAWGGVPTDRNATWNAVAIVAGSNGYRLPTEAQWEYACRAGTTTAYNTGANISDTTGWYDANSGGRTHPVGQKAANRWGLYDMHGNVWEWCWDWHGSYASGAQTDPGGAVSGYCRVARGGSWYNFGLLLRSAFRGNYDPDYWDNGIGFRLVRPL